MPSPKAGWEQPRRELLDNLLILGRRHLEYVLREFVEHYEEARPHQGLGQRTPRQRAPIRASETGPVLRRDVWAACFTSTCARRPDTPDFTSRTPHGPPSARLPPLAINGSTAVCLVVEIAENRGLLSYLNSHNALLCRHHNPIV